MTPSLSSGSGGCNYVHQRAAPPRGWFFNTCFGDCEGRARIISWSSRGPAMDTIIERLPQTMWVLGLAFVFGIMIAIPVGVISAYKQYSWFDNAGTFIAMVGYSLPTFFTGLLAIVIFSVWLGWFPSFTKRRTLSR